MDRFNGIDIPESLADALEPSALALVVYDMQVGILSQIENADRVLANVLRVLDAARGRGVRTLFLRHYFMPTELAGVFQLRQAKAWQRKARAADTRPLIPHGSPGFALVPELEPRAGEAVLDKITMSAFEGTPLNIVLRDCGVRAYVIVGVALESGSSRPSATRPTSATCRWSCPTPAGPAMPRPRGDRWTRWPSPATPSSPTQRRCAPRSARQSRRATRRTGNVRRVMELEEQTLERTGDRCEECGAKLTERELQQVIESGGPALCTVHAAEVVPVADEDPEEPA
jgi:hypothetical protein